ncbi:hypothetical protein EVAR_14002_1 [Eumeta japonica]|uniref:Uncharacterized protein n=1 Tax=Eumeta variegata TaxID=151549 RepID=A0A4C1XAZ9_EUMVA|nr:hypothetical protein EVAR_14002_1 [Eumeta japonica]
MRLRIHPLLQRHQIFLFNPKGKFMPSSMIRHYRSFFSQRSVMRNHPLSWPPGLRAALPRQGMSSGCIEWGLQGVRRGGSTRPMVPFMRFGIGQLSTHARRGRPKGWLVAHETAGPATTPEKCTRGRRGNYVSTVVLTSVQAGRKTNKKSDKMLTEVFAMLLVVVSNSGEC